METLLEIGAHRQLHTPVETYPKIAGNRQSYTSAGAIPTINVGRLPCKQDETYLPPT